MTGDDEIAFLVVPAVAEIEIDWRRRGLVKNLLQFRLIVLFKNLDRADVIAKDANIPFIAIEISKRNSRVVLNDSLAVIQDEITDAVEAVLEHQIRRRLQKTAATTEFIAEPDKAGR